MLYILLSIVNIVKVKRQLILQENIHYLSGCDGLLLFLSTYSYVSVMRILSRGR